MKRKIIGIFIVTLLIVTVVLPVLGSGSPDQSQEEQNGYAYLSRYGYFAQSFKPTLSPLDKVELRLKTYHYNTDLKVSIRDVIDSVNLRSVTISTSDINPENTWTWVEFDFEPDVVLGADKLYYVEVEHYSAGDIDVVSWANSDLNLYTDGEAWQTTSLYPTPTWEKMPSVDFCFKTYSIPNDPPYPPICRYDILSDELVVSSKDYDGDDVRYGVSWDHDGNVDQWTSLHSSGVEVRIDCGGRTGTASVIAEDEHGAQSDWVSVKPKNKAFNTLFLSFLENHPHLFPLLRQLLGLQ